MGTPFSLLAPNIGDIVSFLDERFQVCLFGSQVQEALYDKFYFWFRKKKDLDLRLFMSQLNEKCLDDKYVRGFISFDPCGQNEGRCEVDYKESGAVPTNNELIKTICRNRHTVHDMLLCSIRISLGYSAGR